MEAVLATLIRPLMPRPSKRKPSPHHLRPLHRIQSLPSQPPSRNRPQALQAVAPASLK